MMVGFEVTNKIINMDVMLLKQREMDGTIEINVRFLGKILKIFSGYDNKEFLHMYLLY